MDINFEYYKSFYYVAKYKNITRAAAALGSSQPNVTRILKLLENQLGCRLFIREARGVKLTEKGERLYAHVEIACNHLLNAQEELGGNAVEGMGTVEIGATETALHLCLLEAIGNFKAEYPKIRIKVHNHTTPEILKCLVSGRLDFAVVTTPFEVPKAFQCERILAFHELLAGGVQYSSLAKEKMQLGRLQGYPWVGLGEGTATYEFYKKYFMEHNVEIGFDTEVATSDLLIPLICNNLGIGFVPETMAMPFVKKKKLIQIDLACELPYREIMLISDRGRGKSRAADYFYQYLKTGAANSHIL
ncbi:LysR family transcriptional regulator [bacterium D16-51]|nr:LysR family transcriptional regulator [bacterium D16-59]RKI61173.1 LysR family transcriptional regulator [bacterium D16-51]